MNVTRDIVRDLLPAYLSGEASSDTRQLVEEHLRADPDLEREARNATVALQAIGVATSPPDAAAEKAALDRVKRILRVQRVLFALALTCTLNAFTLGFSFDVGNGRTRVHWLAIPGQTEVTIAIGLVALGVWLAYWRISRHVRTHILG